jgi:hypothetical protein
LTLSPVTPPTGETSTLSPEASGEFPAQPPPGRIARVPLGARIKERYEVRAVLGEGGQGIVYHAWDRKIDGNYQLRVTIPLDEVGRAHHGFDDGQLRIDVTLKNQAKVPTRHAIKLDFALLRGPFSDSLGRSTHCVSLQDGRVRAVPAPSSDETWGALLKSTDLRMRPSNDGPFTLPDSFFGSAPQVLDVQLSADARLLAICGKTDDILLRPVVGDNKTLEHPDAKSVTHLAFSPRGDRLVSVDDKDSLVLHNAGTGSFVSSFSADGRVDELACADGGELVSAIVFRRERTLTVWPAPPTSALPLTLQTIEPTTHALSADGRTAAVLGRRSPASGSSSDADDVLLLVDLSGLRTRRTTTPPISEVFSFPEQPPTSVAFAACGRHLAVGTSSGALMLFAVRAQALHHLVTLIDPLQQDDLQQNAVTCLRFDGDRQLVAGTQNGDVFVWDLPETAMAH